MRTIKRTSNSKPTEENDFCSQRIYIAARGDKSTRITYDTMSGASKIVAYNCDNGADLITNCALLVEDTLEKLQALDLSKVSEPVTIFAPGNFVDQIHNSTYLFWLMKGQKSDGTELTEDELALWESIESKLVAVHRFVRFKNISTARLVRKGRGIKTTPLQEKDNELQQVAWNRVPGQVDETEIEEEDRSAGQTA